MSLVIAYYKDKKQFFLLSGYESTYIKRKYITTDLNIKNDVEFETNPSTHYVIDDDMYSIRIQSEKAGFPKGGSKNGETSIDTAIREFKEETGNDLQRDKLKKISDTKNSTNSNAYTVFTYKVSNEEKNEFIFAIEEMKNERRGELFDTQFRTIDELNSMNLNVKSQNALGLFRRKQHTLSGGKKTRKTKNASKG